MFDFRYHVVSIVAVFLALAIGILLGVTIADKVVSSAERDLRSSLWDDLGELRDERADALRELRRSDEFESLVYPAVVHEKLSRKRIGVISIGKVPGGIVDDASKALKPSGTRLVSITAVRTPLRIERLAVELKGSEFEDLETSTEIVGKLGKSMGLQMVRGGRLPARLKRTVFSSHSGSLSGLDGVIFARSKRSLEGREERDADLFESSMIKGMLESKAPVVGVERLDTETSQIVYYRDHDLTSVDDIDEVPGRVALVFALLGARGQFGIKPTANQLLPQTLLSGKGKR